MATFARNPHLVACVRRLLILEICLTETILNHKKEVQERFGKKLSILRKKYRSPEMIHVLPKDHEDIKLSSPFAAPLEEEELSFLEGKNLLNKLQWLGLTEYEAKTYLGVCEAFSVTAAEVSSLSGIPSTNTYAALHNLEIKGLIQRATEQPIRYTLRDPEEFFSHLSQDISRRCEEINQMIHHHARKLEKVYVETFKEDKTTKEKFREMINGAQRYIRVMTNSKYILPYLDVLIDALERGVSITLIVHETEMLNLNLHDDINIVKHTFSYEDEHIPLLTVTIDLKEFLVVSKTPQLATYIRNPSIVFIAEQYLLHEIYVAELLTVFGEKFFSFTGLLDEIKHLNRKN